MATEIKPEKMWAIWNKNFGFYIGTWLSREEAIHYHVESKTAGATWEFCKSRGDRCIRVEISAAQPKRAADSLKAGETPAPRRVRKSKVIRPAKSG